MSEHVDLANAAMQVLGPALPALTGTVTQAVTELAKATWNTIRPWLIQDPPLDNAAKALADKPQSAARQAAFEEALAEHLEKVPAHSEALGAELAKGKVVQRILAEDGSKVWKVVMDAGRGGEIDQRIEARGNSSVSDVQMIGKK